MSEKSNEQVIDDALAVVREARNRAPADFITALGVILGLGALGLLIAAFLASGVAQDFLLNFGVELIGAWITVVVINGLWRRLEVGTYASLDAMATRLAERRGSPMTEAEELAWRTFVNESRALWGATSILDRVRRLPTYQRRMRALEAQGNRTLDEFRHAAEEAPAPH